MHKHKPLIYLYIYFIYINSVQILTLIYKIIYFHQGCFSDHQPYFCKSLKWTIRQGNSLVVNTPWTHLPADPREPVRLCRCCGINTNPISKWLNIKGLDDSSAEVLHLSPTGLRSVKCVRPLQENMCSVHCNYSNATQPHTGKSKRLGPSRLTLKPNCFCELYAIILANLIQSEGTILDLY